MSKNEVFIHPSAIVQPEAQLDVGVWVGPYSVIGSNVRIGKNTKIDSHVIIDGWTEIGTDCCFFSFSSESRGTFSCFGADFLLF